MDKFKQTVKNKSPNRTELELRGTKPKFVNRAQALKSVNEILENEIQLEEREWTGPGKKGSGRFQQVGGKLPKELIGEVKLLGGTFMHHVEKSLKLYLIVLESKQ